jgi:hypothetical protein
VDLDQVIALRRTHMPKRVRWWRQRHPRCAACRDTWPCGEQRFARARIVALLREQLDAARGRRW